jgi:hypothetical protein
MSLTRITRERYDRIRELYFAWKELNIGIKEYYTRGVNLHEALTETVCCYINNYLLSVGEGSEDAIIPSTNELVQVKATSNWNSDLTSFGPYSSFNHLHFVRLNQAEDKMYLYYIPTETLKGLYVNATETFEEQQRQGRRPRFSIINKYIIPYNIQPYAVADMRTGEVVVY